MNQPAMNDAMQKSEKPFSIERLRRLIATDDLHGLNERREVQREYANQIQRNLTDISRRIQVDRC